MRLAAGTGWTASFFHRPTGLQYTLVEAEARSGKAGGEAVGQHQHCAGLKNVELHGALRRDPIIASLHRRDHAEKHDLIVGGRWRPIRLKGECATRAKSQFVVD